MLAPQHYLNRGECWNLAASCIVPYKSPTRCVLTPLNLIMSRTTDRRLTMSCDASIVGSSCVLCEWTSASDLATVRAAGPPGGYDLVLGADVCYGQSALPAVGNPKP